MASTIPIVLYLSTNMRAGKMYDTNCIAPPSESHKGTANTSKAFRGKSISQTTQGYPHITQPLLLLLLYLYLERDITVVVGAVDMWISRQISSLLSSWNYLHPASRAHLDYVDKLST